MSKTVNGRQAAAYSPQELGIRPLTARSVILSALLGSHPPMLPVRALLAVGELFGIAEGTIRVAVSRMASEGDLTRDADRYRLNSRLAERQRRQDEARHPHLRPWQGEWQMAVVTAPNRTAPERTRLRSAMTQLRMAQLREGTWLRPSNLAIALPPGITGQCQLFTAIPHGSLDDQRGLAAQLWDLDSWQDKARCLLDALERSIEPAQRFTVAAAIVRHLMSDPLLPDELLPERWPGANLRQSYAAATNEIRQLVISASNPT